MMWLAFVTPVRSTLLERHWYRSVPDPLATTESVTVTPGRTSWLCGCTEICGGVVTNNVTVSLRTDPAALSTNTWYSPALAGWALSKVRLALVAFGRFFPLKRH